MSTQTQIIKTKEVWRDAKGHFVPVPQPVKVAEPEPKQPDTIPAQMLIGGTVLVIAAVYWQITLALAFAAGAGYAIRWHLKRPRIIINNYANIGG